ncbi:hypothetical protein BMS3Abin05_02350 [bacterium BMS3Abin05]|nr:hypothetical protein BMS3Abin05_02350 [bacterium BMS3Abin05]GBE26391.1 hypothetical protein BMS3Bbin03_00304 [bacterium BMS3Bbin03]
MFERVDLIYQLTHRLFFKNLPEIKLQNRNITP